MSSVTIGIIGSGNIGGALGRLWRNAGHKVMFGTRVMANKREFAESIGALIGTVTQAASFGDVVVLATPWRNPEALPPINTVKGKIVIDTMNPYTPSFGLYDLGDSTSSEETLRRLQGVRLVKAFNTIAAQRLANDGDMGLACEYRLVIPISGNDVRAKGIVAQLVREIGFGPLDSGQLA